MWQTRPQSRDRFFTSAQEKEIAAAFRQVIDGRLTDISALLGGKYDIGELRVFRAFANEAIRTCIVRERLKN